MNTFAVCGFGRIGKRHAHIINEYENTGLNGIIDINPNLESEVEQEGYQVSVFSDLDSFLEADNNNTDVINICTPNYLHAPLALKALKSGYHVVIEKPMALSKKDCEMVIDISLKTGRQVFVVKQNRYSPTSVWLKEIVKNEIIGDIDLVQINCFWNRDERYYESNDWHGSLEMDGGVLFTQFSHFVDIMYWVFGDIRKIQARMINFNHDEMTEFEDSGIVQFEFIEGGMGAINFSTSCWDRNMESSITVIGSRGSVKLGGQYMNEVKYCHIENYEIPKLPETNPPNDYGPYRGSAANHHYVIENVVDTLNGSSFITANALEGMKVVEIIEKIYEHRSK